MNDIIGMVAEAFIVICGVAVTQFFTDGGTVVDQDPILSMAGLKSQTRYPRLWHWLCYILALIVLVTLVLRFLFGSHAQMMGRYQRIDEQTFRGFVTDVSFLMFFGAFLVGAALSKTVRAFMGWLTLISGVGVFWCLIAQYRGEGKLAGWWLGVNLVQLLVVLSLFLWCRNEQQASRAARWGLVIAGVAFMILFCFDLQMIMLNKVVIFGKTLASF